MSDRHAAPRHPLGDIRLGGLYSLGTMDTLPIAYSASVRLVSPSERPRDLAVHPPYGLRLQSIGSHEPVLRAHVHSDLEVGTFQAAFSPRPDMVQTILPQTSAASRVVPVPIVLLGTYAALRAHLERSCP